MNILLTTKWINYLAQAKPVLLRKANFVRQVRART